MPAKTINLARSPFKRHALSMATDWTKRRDLCGTLISHGGSSPAGGDPDYDVFCQKMQDLIDKVREVGYVRSK